MQTLRHTPRLLWAALLLIPFAPACELIPGLIADNAPPPGSTSAPLTVAIDSARGEIAGQTLALATLDAHGMQQPSGVDLTIVIDGDTFLELTTPEPVGGDNPYGGGLLGDEPRGFPEGDAGASGALSLGPRPVVTVCSDRGCRTPLDFTLHSSEAADGRHMVFEGQWDDGDRAEIELHYTREQ